MYRFYLAAADMLPVAVLLIPVYWIFNRVYFHNTKKSIFYMLFSCYLSVIYILVGLPNVTYIRPELNLNLVPIIGIIDDWKNSILNVLLFVPLGMMLPVLWQKFKTIKKSVFFGFCISLMIECLQTLTFRVTDVNDLITNTLGTLVGFLCIRFFPKKILMGGEDNTIELVIVLSIVLIVMFFAYPFVSSALWDFILS